MKARPKGFTLLEVLVALVLFGLVLATLTQGIRFGSLAWRADSRSATRDADLDTVDLTLRHLIEAADPGTADRARPAMIGGRDFLRFISRLPAIGPTVPARLAETMLVVDAGHRLVLHWRPPPGARPGEPPPPAGKTELLSGVSRLDLAFWDGMHGWVGSWESARLPAMIRIRLVFRDAPRRHWPDIVAAPALDQR